MRASPSHPKLLCASWSAHRLPHRHVHARRIVARLASGRLTVKDACPVSSQGSNPLSNWKLSSPKHIRKIYDKITRGYVFDLGVGTQPCRMQLPNDKVRAVAPRLRPFAGERVRP